MRSPLEDPSTAALVPMSTLSKIAHADNFELLTEESSPERLDDLGLQSEVQGNFSTDPTSGSSRALPYELTYLKYFRGLDQASQAPK